MKVLKMAKLVIDIIKDTRSLLFCNQPWKVRVPRF
jgi:hypothetical protein